MVRFSDSVKIWHYSGTGVYDPFADDSARSKTKVYDGECRVRITSGYNLSDKLKKANYTVSIPVGGEELSSFINERDYAELQLKGMDEPIQCTVIEFMPYDRNCILYLMYAKDGEIED